jgi:N-acetylglutamate synthase/N-acetylornithine aminotransferase
LPYQRIPGGVTAPAGFVAASTYCGIKSGGRDLTVLLADAPSVAAAVLP